MSSVTRYSASVAASSATTSSGENGGRRSRSASRTPTSPSRWATASVIESAEPPLGSQNATYATPSTGGSSRRSGTTQASTTSRETNESTSRRNSAPYSAAARSGSSA